MPACAPPCGYCLKASMTGRGWLFCLVSPSPLIPLPSRERGKWLVWIAITLTFDSSPIKGEGDMVGVGLSFAPPCGYCLEASMTGAPGLVVLSCVTLTFDSSPIKGEGDIWLVLSCCCPASLTALWIDESPMNLYEILGFQPKGVATLSFSSR